MKDLFKRVIEKNDNYHGAYKFLKTAKELKEAVQRDFNLVMDNHIKLANGETIAADKFYIDRMADERLRNFFIFIEENIQGFDKSVFAENLRHNPDFFNT